MSALGHCLELQDTIVAHSREWERLMEETEAMIAEQPSLSAERQSLRNVLAEEQKLNKALAKLLDVNQDTINRLDSLEMLGKGKAG